jgi:hypothetical protein
MRANIFCAVPLLIALTVHSAAAEAVLARPALDDVTYGDLVSEVAARIPAHAPEWTNQDASDPGFSLLDLFGFLDDIALDAIIDEYHTRDWWRTIDKNSEKFLGELAYTLLEAALLIALPPGDLVPKDWPSVYSVELDQNFDELRASARVPEPGAVVLMGLGLIGLVFARRVLISVPSKRRDR